MFLARLLFAASSQQRIIWPQHIRSLFGSLVVAPPSPSSRHSSQCLLHRHLQCHIAQPALHHVVASHLHTSALLTEDDVSKTEVPDAQKSSSGDSTKSNTDNSKAASPPAPPRLVLSDRCRTRLQTVLDPDEVLRIGVRGGGCSGFEYEFSVEKASTIKANEDLVFEGKVVVDSESIEYMSGAQLDYENELIRSGFRVVNNPLAEKGCSCGSSFSLKF